MVERTEFIRELRRLGYSYKETKKRVDLWRKKGDTHKVLLPRRDLLTISYVRTTLKQIGCSDEEIEAFIKGE